MSERSLREEIRQLVDELAAARERIRELEASREWEPVESGFSYREPETEALSAGYYRLDTDGKFICITRIDDEDDFHAVRLPDDVCLMRRRPQPQEQ